MATIGNDPNGTRRILVVGTDGRRRTIRLGKVSESRARRVKEVVEDLLTSSALREPPSDKTRRWLARQDARMIDKLARVGLVEPREDMSLWCWLDRYLQDRRRDLKPGSVAKLHQTAEKLKALLGPDVRLHTITVQHAAEWRQYLRDAKLSEATVKIHSGNAKGFFAEAVRRKLIPENPFRYLKAGSTATKHTRYVTPEEADRLIDACPTAEWRLLFGLARLAGLRV